MIEGIAIMVYIVGCMILIFSTKNGIIPIWAQVIGVLLMTVGHSLQMVVNPHMKKLDIVLSSINIIMWGWIVLERYSTTMYEKDRKAIIEMWNGVFIAGLAIEDDYPIPAEVWKMHVEQLCNQELQQLEQWK